jgi:hypothetical protein
MVLGTTLGLVEGVLAWIKYAGQPCPGVLGEPPTKLKWQSGHNLWTFKVRHLRVIIALKKKSLVKSG